MAGDYGTPERYEPNNVFHTENFAIAMSYFSIGIADSFITTPLNVYMVNVLKAEPDVQNTMLVLQMMPWSLKLIFGFLSDACPIWGMHRKPYLMIGACIQSLSFMIYSLLAIDSAMVLAMTILIGTLGLIQMDVMADTMCVERSKLEPEGSKGQMQASFYSIRFAGSLVGAVAGACMSNKELWGWSLSFFQVAFIQGILPFVLVVPWLFVLREKYPKRKHYSNLHDRDSLEMTVSTADTSNTHPSMEQRPLLATSSTDTKWTNAESSKGEYGQYYQLSASDDCDSGGYIPTTYRGSYDLQDEWEELEPLKATSISAQAYEIWQTVQLRAVWRTMFFVFIFHLFQVPNVAWQSYLQLSLHFEPWILGLTVVLGCLMTFAGVLAYKVYFFGMTWRLIYIWSSVLTSFFSLMQLALIFQWNQYFHISNYFFAVGDDVITAYISGIQFLPICIMCMRLCPAGSEGASYAILTTFGNIALACASNIGAFLATSGLFDVSNAAMRNNDISGLWKLSVTTSLASLVPLSFLWLLPVDSEHQMKLADSKERSAKMGVVFLVVLSFSIVWCVSYAVTRLAL